MTSIEEKSVAILIDDLKEAKELSLVFRKLGIIPEIYENLASFWTGVLTHRPSFTIIDVRKLNEGELIFAQHPIVKDKNVGISFFWNDSTEPLLFSTYEIFNLGLIRQGSSYQGQVKSILKRYNELFHYKNLAEQAIARRDYLEKQIEKVVASTETTKEKEYYQTLLKSLVGRFENQKNSETFEDAITNVFANAKEIKEFSLMELSPSNQKLVSAKISTYKYKEIPSLWLGRVCEKGIEFFAQNMASQVALELIGGEIMSLLIKGSSNHPERLLFLRVENEEVLENMDWESLERYLSGYYTYFELKNKATSTNDSIVWTPWELHSFLDQKEIAGTLSKDPAFPEGASLIDLNFSNLVKFISSKNGIKFYWSQFYRDFFNQMRSVRKIEANICSYGASHVALVIGHEKLEKTFVDLKHFVTKFPIWRYFEDTEIAISKNLKPEIKMIPLSVKAFRAYVEEGDYYPSPALVQSRFIENEVKANKKPLRIKGPDQTM